MVPMRKKIEVVEGAFYHHVTPRRNNRIGIFENKLGRKIWKASGAFYDANFVELFSLLMLAMNIIYRK
jgi:hypothetical protein